MAVQILVLVQVHLLVHIPVLLPCDAVEDNPVDAGCVGCNRVVDLVADSDAVVGVDIDYGAANLVVVDDVAAAAAAAIVLPHHYC